MRKKNLVSLLVAGAFAALSVTGIMLYVLAHTKATTMIHTVFGLAFVGFAAFHIRNNFTSLRRYSKERQRPTVRKEFLVSAAVVGAVLVGTWLRLPPFEQIEEAGEYLRKGGQKREERVTFVRVRTNEQLSGMPLTLTWQKDKAAHLPAVAVWVEDSARRFVENLFVPAQVVTVKAGETDVEEALREGEIETNALAATTFVAWRGKATTTAPNYAQATPKDNFILSTRTTARGRYFVCAEVRDDTRVERYEAAVDATRGVAFRLRSANPTPLARVLIEVE